jgi:hypothetical protein
VALRRRPLIRRRTKNTASDEAFKRARAEADQVFRDDESAIYNRFHP